MIIVMLWLGDILYCKVYIKFVFLLCKIMKFIFYGERKMDINIRRKFCFFLKKFFKKKIMLIKLKNFFLKCILI